jgi:hypothetical protein
MPTTDPVQNSAVIDDPLLLRDRVIAEATVHFERGEAEIGIAALRRLETAAIDETTIRMTDAFFRQWIVRDRKVVASFDQHRIPAEHEIVIIYGNYPHIYDNLVINNPIRRHVASFWDLAHDSIEYDKSWDAVDQIYIINIDKRTDRLDAVLRELGSAKAPFHRITRISGAIPSDPAPNRKLAGQIACLESHLAVLRQAHERGFAHILVLEDDFCFTSELHRHMQDLAAFFERQYPYWICLLATSKYGPIFAKDDVVSLSFQPCTNTGAYLVSREGVRELLAVQEEALKRLITTGDFTQFAVDRYWSILQPSGKFLVFKRKFGFQHAGFSDIEGSVTRYLD